MPTISPAVDSPQLPLPAWLDGLRGDLRFSARSLAKAAGFSFAVVFTLALCIGANTAIFSSLYSFLLQPLPFREPGQLVEVYNTYPKTGVPKTYNSIAQYLDYKAHADLFERFALQGLWIFAIGEESEAMRMRGQRVSTDFFDVFGVAPFRGRLFTADDGTPGKSRVMVITQSFWENYFHADPAVIGKDIRISGETITVVGVAPRIIEAIDGKTVAFTPLSLPPQVNPQSRYAVGFEIYARLKPGVSLGAGIAQLNTLERRFQEQEANPAVRAFVERTGEKVNLGHLRDEQTRDIKPGLLLLQAGVLLVLLIGCVNVANLILARCNTRRPELAIRQALGASRAALVRQLLIESFILALAGAVGGLALAWGIIRLINAHFRSFDGQVITVAISPPILAATLLVTVSVAVGVALHPILQLWRKGAGKGASMLQQGSRGAAGDRQVRRVSGVLVTAQIVIAFILLICAGLLVRSFAKVMAVDPGFEIEQIASGRIMVPTTYQGPEKQQSLQERLIADLGQIAGVEAVGLMANVILDPKSNPPSPFSLRSTMGEGSQPMANFWSVSAGFFGTLGIPLLEGRDFSAADRTATRLPLIVDRVMAEKFFPGRSAVGQTLTGPFGSPAAKESDWPVIVGVVERARLTSSDDQRNLPSIYVPLRGAGNLTLLLRSDRPADELLKELRTQMHRLDPTIPLYMTSSLQWRLENAMRDRRAIMQLLAAFAVLALVLAAVGIYGMLAYDVSQRTREIGIRGAIGASRGQIVGLILREGMWKTGIGLALGLAGALTVTRFMRTMLFDVQPVDFTAYIAVVLVLAVVAFLASYLPALRAAKVNPVVALRCE